MLLIAGEEENVSRSGMAHNFPAIHIDFIPSRQTFPASGAKIQVSGDRSQE